MEDALTTTFKHESADHDTDNAKMDREHVPSNSLKVRSVNIDTYRENIIYMRGDCPICKSEGFSALTRIVVYYGERSIIATLNVVSDLVGHGEAGLSNEALKRLQVQEGYLIQVGHLKPMESFKLVRSKMYGHVLESAAFEAIINDIADGRYSNVELAAFITACSGKNLSDPEIISLTRAMIKKGEKLYWNKAIILDKHCIGGLPGNRTTPIVVSIVAAAGLTIPKTSSRAITSPAGTADTMETLTRVDLTLSEMRKVVEKEGGCFAWGGAMQLSPADDVIISVEKALDIDSEGQMIASVLSKKAAAGSTHVIIDIPVGETAKVRTAEEAKNLAIRFNTVGQAIGLQVKTVITDGTQPVGVGIGPALEALDVLAVLRNDQYAPEDLKQRAMSLAANLLEISGHFTENESLKQATKLLESGKAFEKFVAICHAQGSIKEPMRAQFRYDWFSDRAGRVEKIDNRQLARLAKLAGAPKSPGAGLRFYAPLGTSIARRDLLLSVFAESAGELDYAKEFLRSIAPELLILSS
ncbi:MAG: thymidine phosphorylase family protein [Chitinophagales bacterium]|nr:thymidine phosphorylase family protein [Chitinophagales bacterium]